ncbi:MAG TPA: ABC transporter permease [Burkholderiaceae bacterium]|jgi:NitT/TauT family transport system permease protein
MKSKFKSRSKAFFKGLIVPALLLVIWELGSRSGMVSSVVLPSPSAVITSWLASVKPAQPFDSHTGSYIQWLFSGDILRDSFSTMSRVLIGFFVGAGLALPLGLMMGTSKHIYELVNPMTQVLRPIPPIAYIPLAILWFGLGNPPSVFLISIGAFFPVLMNTIAGVRHVDSIYVRAAQNLGVSQMTMFWRVILPAATPYIFAGIRIGIGTAFICVIVAEMIAVNDGLGYRILEAREFMWSDKIIAGMITIGILGLALDLVMDKLNNYLLRWHRSLEQ